MESNPVTETLRAIYSLHNRFNEIHQTLTKAPRILALHHQRVDAQQKILDDASAQLLEQKTNQKRGRHTGSKYFSPVILTDKTQEHRDRKDHAHKMQYLAY